MSSLNNFLMCMMVSQVAPNQAHWEAIKIQDRVTQQFSLLPTFCTTSLPFTWHTLPLFMTVLFTAPYVLELSVAANQQNGLQWVRERKHQTAQGLLSAPLSALAVGSVVSSFLCSAHKALPACWCGFVLSHCATPNCGLLISIRVINNLFKCVPL